MKLHYSAHTVSRKAFKVTACVDWLDVVVHTSRVTQFQYIQKVIKDVTGETLRVDPLDKREEEGGNATMFKIRFRDGLANHVQSLTLCVAAIEADYPFVTAPTIHGIEVACDFYHKGPETTRVRELVAMSYRLQSSLFAPSATKPRQFDPTLGAVGANRFMDEGTRLDPTLNFHIGNEWDGLMWQVYFKQTDNKLTMKDRKRWRARVEVRIKGETLQGLGLRFLSDLDGYNFAKLMPHFRFRRPVDMAAMETQMGGDLYRLSALRLNRSLHDATAARGIHSFAGVGWLGKRNGTLAESRHLEPDNELQRAVKGAMRRLTLKGSCPDKGTEIDRDMNCVIGESERSPTAPNNCNPCSSFDTTDIDSERSEETTETHVNIKKQ